MYPLDVHSAAQSVITLTELRDLGPDDFALAARVLTWTVRNLWDERGYFYYQKRAIGTVRIPYMRWSQAWMLRALSAFLEAGRGRSSAEPLNRHEIPRPAV